MVQVSHRPDLKCTHQSSTGVMGSMNWFIALGVTKLKEQLVGNQASETSWPAYSRL